jgi:hypothetical protein
MGGVRHRLHPAGDHDVGLAARDHLVGEVDGIQTRETDLVDAGGGHVEGETAVHRGLAGRDLTLVGHEHLAHVHVLHIAGRDPGTLDGGRDGDATQLGRREAGEGSGHLPDRRASAGDDVRTRHGCLPLL